jgi:cell division septal protein FtsQ
VHLQLKTAQGIVTVLLGPNWFLARQPLKFSPLDRLEVTGSKITLQGKPVLVAAAVKKGEQVLKLRTEQGMPLWGKQSGSGQ